MRRDIRIGHDPCTSHPRREERVRPGVLTGHRRRGRAILARPARGLAGEALVQTQDFGSVLTVRNPTWNPMALTITPKAGGSRPVAATLIIERLR